MINKIRLILLISILSCTHQSKNLKMLHENGDDSVSSILNKNGSNETLTKELNDEASDSSDDEDEISKDEIEKPTEVVPDEINESSTLSTEEKDIIRASYVKEGYNPKLINYWIHYFTQKKPELFQQHLNNGNDYRALVTAVLREYGVPEEIYYLGLIESGYNMKIRSKANAVGPWQFIKGTGKRYGLTTTHFVDERRNIYKSTVAAAKYLKNLYDMFGKWELAAAAYNCGENRIIRAMKKGNTDNINTLTEMKLIPLETRYYVPKILAAEIIDKNLEKYGFTRNEFRPETNTEVFSMEVKHTLDLNKVVKMAKVPKETILFYNPDIKENYIPGSNGKPFKIFLPKNEYNLVTQVNLNQCTTKLPAIKITKVAKRHKRSDGKRSIATDLKSGKTYRVKRGDNLHKIASKFRVDLKKLISANKLKSRTVMPNQHLVIPN